MSISRSMMKKLATVSALGLGAALFQGDTAKADTATGTLSVSAEVIDGCVIAAAPLDFGQYNALTAVDTDVPTTITVTCPTGSVWNVELGQGMSPVGNAPDNPVRQMAHTDTVNNPTARLGYALYSDSGHSLNWGAGLSRVAGTVDIGETLTVYGRIPAGQNVPVGNYVDSVIATINY